MMAPIALYPDSLLAQVLMASTYPGDVADAVKWSEAHKDAKGEAAVKQVADQPRIQACSRWSPSRSCWPCSARTRPGCRRWAMRYGPA